VDGHWHGDPHGAVSATQKGETGDAVMPHGFARFGSKTNALCSIPSFAPAHERPPVMFWHHSPEPIALR
jgi:hypothetical protein